MSIILIFNLLILSSCTSTVLSDDGDEAVLLKIKEQLGNPSNWNTQTGFCSGLDSVPPPIPPVRCTSSGRVSSLVLQDFNTATPFPDAICDLTELEYFVIFNNSELYGPIPSCVNKLFNLQVFIILKTSLSGPVPDFPNHKNLLIINLSGNQFSGPIPPSLSAIPKLGFLDLSFNHLTGTIPDVLVHGSPGELSLNNNNLTGELSKCYGWASFRRLDLGNNQLSGDASFLFGNQKTTNWIDLSNNDFEFDLSYVEISNSLGYLNMSHNRIWGKVPDSTTGISILDLSYNKLCGEIPQTGPWYWYKAEAFVNNMCLCGKPLSPCLAPEPAMAPL